MKDSDVIWDCLPTTDTGRFPKILWKLHIDYIRLLVKRQQEGKKVHGCSKVQMVEPRHTDFTEETVPSAFSVYEKRVLSIDFATTMKKLKSIL